ncbi:NAD(P)/FAD-dependent oxidoreductase [uncultured Lacinutrix sp.]|uniref:NAD(P)/FAD-dependent oxidoreductase n=1 Tax=uncultured Lacinutrix sp. TaxID=574032 RepID=UPI002617AC12|nr:NAD(P)/FAD-dependent oxidoreductase [uncultured Lacinutrix sp.]
MNTEDSYFDVIIVGGGLAGLSSAIHLSKFKIKVLVIEKNTYPKHKVCGEYISNEVLPYLKFLDIDVFKYDAHKINSFELTTIKNKIIKVRLPLGGFGISRYCLDNILAKKVLESNVEILKDAVEDITFINKTFSVKTKSDTTYKAKLVIGAYGKRANLDTKLNRQFIKEKSPFLAVKIHATGNFPDNLVALHNFKGGYCGVSKVENNKINICYITNYNTFKKHKNIQAFQKEILYKNEHLKSIFKNSTSVFDVPLTISQISFLNKKPVENHVLMCGDTAGMIHPLAGNGMSMAIRSAQIVSSLIIDYLDGNIKSRYLLEKQYSMLWNKEFKNRINTGKFIAYLFSLNIVSEIIVLILKPFPKVLQYIIKRTHGKIMTTS